MVINHQFVMIRGQMRWFHDDNLEILLFDMFYRTLMVKPRLNQRILASFRRKKVKLGQFLKGEDNMPIFMLKCCVTNFGVVHHLLLCYKYFVNRSKIRTIKCDRESYGFEFNKRIKPQG